MRARLRLLLIATAAVLAGALVFGQLSVGAREPTPAAVGAPAVPSAPESSEAAGERGPGSIEEQIEDDRAIAAAAGLKIGTVPQIEGRALAIDDLPDLIPVVDAAGKVFGYARAEEAFVELFDPSQDFVAYGVYAPDGATLLGYEVPEVGFVAGKKAVVTSTDAVIPDGESPLSE